MILLIAPKRCSALHSDACYQVIILQYVQLTFRTYKTPEIQKKTGKASTAGTKKEAAAEAKKEEKMELGLKEVEAWEILTRFDRGCLRIPFKF